MAGPEHVHRHADEVEHHRRHVEHVVGPVTPAGEESVKVAEHLFRPKINAAFAGIAMGEFDHRDALRPKEEEKRDDPQPDGDPAVGGDRRNNVEIEYGDDEEQHQIAASEGADQVRLGFGLSRRGHAWCCRPRNSRFLTGLFSPVRNDKDFFSVRPFCLCNAGADECVRPHANLVCYCDRGFALLLRFRQRLGDVVER